MELLHDLARGFSVILTVQSLLYCFLGVFLGTFIGVLPGMGALAAISILLPLTFHLDPTIGIIVLSGIYYGSQYGGSTASILLNLPGTPSTAITCLDGYPMAKQGRGGVALVITAVGSFVGASIGIIALIAFTPWLSKLALAFSPADYFGVMVFGLVISASVGQGPPLNGIAMVAIGVLLGLVGSDIETGVMRFTLGMPALEDGVNLVALAMGTFGVSEIIASGSSSRAEVVKPVRFMEMLPTRDDLVRSVGSTLRGTALGSFIGTLPGAGPTLASFLSYGIEKRVASDPDRFGKGAVEGVAAPEASNNAAAQTSFVPTLAMGIPGDAVMALMLGALMIHGIAPGPGLMRDHPDLFWGLIASFWIGNVMLLLLNLPLIGIWVKLLQIPYRYMFPGIACLISIGVYTVNANPMDIMAVLFFGAVGCAMRLLNLEPAPLLIGFVLGPLMEENLRRALLIARGDALQLFSYPICGSFLALAVLCFLWPFFRTAVKQRFLGGERQARLPLRKTE